MSFLNPVSEPVKRFSSTDAGAPQINYNARTAGDVKAVLKACLVDGYGAVTSAGWTAANEAGNIIEFVSTSAAMSDYRLGVDDTSTSSTTWYYQYQNARLNPTNNAITKNHTNVNLSSAKNGWQLLVSPRGIVFVAMLYSDIVGDLVSYVLQMGQVKSAYNGASDENMSFWAIGHNCRDPDIFFRERSSYHYRVAGVTGLAISASNLPDLQSTQMPVKSYVSVMSPLYLNSDSNSGSSYLSAFIGVQPNIIAGRVDAAEAKPYGVKDKVIDGRNMLCATATYSGSKISDYQSYARAICIPLDYWEY